MAKRKKSIHYTRSCMLERKKSIDCMGDMIIDRKVDFICCTKRRKGPQEEV